MRYPGSPRQSLYADWPRPKSGSRPLAAKPLNRFTVSLQRAGRYLHLAREIGDGVTSQDRAPLDQLFAGGCAS